jgi:zinc protease
MIAKPGVTPEKLEAEAEKIIDGWRQSGPTAEEVEWARNKHETRAISGLQRLGGFGGVADQLNYYNQYTGDPGYLPKDLARYDAVTPASVQKCGQGDAGQGSARGGVRGAGQEGVGRRAAEPGRYGRQREDHAAAHAGV